MNALFEAAQEITKIVGKRLTDPFEDRTGWTVATFPTEHEGEKDLVAYAPDSNIPTPTFRIETTQVGRLRATQVLTV